MDDMNSRRLRAIAQVSFLVIIGLAIIFVGA